MTWHLLSRGSHCSKFNNYRAIEIEYWVDIIFSKTSNLTLTFDRVIWTSIRAISLEAFIVLCLANYQGSRDIKRTTFFSKTSSLTFDHMTWTSKEVMRGIPCTKFGNFPDKQFDLELCPCGLKIKRCHLLLGHPLYEVWQLSSKERISLRLHTDRPTGAKQYASLIQRGHNKTKFH